MIRLLRTSSFWCLIFLTSSCVFIPQGANYQGPSALSAEQTAYYAYTHKNITAQEVMLEDRTQYFLRRIHLATEYGEVTVDYYQQKNSSPNLILVFPILGGNYFIENHFADYFTVHGIDAAIVHRDLEFKKPKNVPNIEEIFRNSVIRDRIVMDYFQAQYGKESFASFGISRGAINAAMTAGVDSRLEHNVFVLGGTDIVEVFKTSDQPGLEKYRRRVRSALGITDDEFYKFLEKNIKTDPKNLSPAIDARKTLLMLARFDHTVPYASGAKLREQIGDPETLIFLGNHYTTLIFTQMVKILPPIEEFCLFPFDYVESEALRFYNRSFKTGKWRWKDVPLTFFHVPFDIGVKFYRLFTGVCGKDKVSTH
ncbi:hypothetical protein JNK13_10800 [bacterium]|nr:hypothetical protein [bacterium]